MSTKIIGALAPSYYELLEVHKPVFDKVTEAEAIKLAPEAVEGAYDNAKSIQLFFWLKDRISLSVLPCFYKGAIAGEVVAAMHFVNKSSEYNGREIPEVKIFIDNFSKTWKGRRFKMQVSKKHGMWVLGPVEAKEFGTYVLTSALAVQSGSYEHTEPKNKVTVLSRDAYFKTLSPA